MAKGMGNGMGRLVRGAGRALRGMGAAFRARPRTFLAVALAVFLLNLLLPPVLLSLVRKPWTYFAFNAWLPNLPAFLASSEVPLKRKLEFLPNLALFWFNADGPYGSVEWGYAVDVTDLVRFVFISLLVGAYFALWFQRQDRATGCGWTGRAGRNGGVVGALAGVLGLSTGPCSVMGCGAPVLPVVGLAFAGLTSGTLALLAGISRVATAAVLLGMTAAVAYLGWRAGADPPAGGPTPYPS